MTPEEKAADALDFLMKQISNHALNAKGWNKENELGNALACLKKAQEDAQKAYELILKRMRQEVAKELTKILQDERKETANRK